MRKMLVGLLAAALLWAAGCAKAGEAGGAAAARSPEPGAQAAQSPQPSPQPRTAQADGEWEKQLNLGSYFKDKPGTFVIYDLKNDRYARHNAGRAQERFSPFSTFKIPNSIIGLETGVIKDADFLIKWDEKKYPRYGSIAPFTEWWRDQTLRTAFKRSALWYYRELASRVGEQRMKEMVTKLHYGNEDISGGIDRFWLNSSMKISADEQVEFLKAFHQGRLPVSERAARIVKEIMTMEQTPDYRLSGKTGSGPIGEDRFLGWLVGFVETKDNTHFFALQIEGPTFLSVRDERHRLTRQILTDMGMMGRRKSNQ